MSWSRGKNAEHLSNSHPPIRPILMYTFVTDEAAERDRESPQKGRELI